MCWTGETGWYAADARAAQVSKDLQDSHSWRISVLFLPLFWVWCDCGFCLFCFVLPPTCVIQNQVHAEEDENDEEKEEEKMEVDAEEKSPEKDETKAKDKHAGDNEDELEIPATKETSEIKASEEEKTDKSDTECSEKDSCKVEGVLSVSSNAIDNKENETKGDDK